MVVYLYALAVSLIFATTNQGNNGARCCARKRKIGRYQAGFLLVALPFILVSCLRDHVGTDYSAYTEFYPNYVLVQDGKVEPIFHAVIYMSAKILGLPHLIVVFFGLLITPMLFSFIYRYSKDILLSIVVFFLSGIFNYSLNIMRQTLAVAIFFWAVQFIEGNEWKKYFTVIIFCFFVHKTSILFFAVYFFGKFKLSRVSLLTIPIISIFLPGIVGKVIGIVSSRFGLYSGYFASQYNATYSVSLLFINLVAYILGLANVDLKKNRMTAFFVNMQLVALLLCEWMPVIPNGGRIVYMMMPVQCVLIPNSLRNIKNINVRAIACGMVVLAYCLFFIYYFVVQNYGETFPFHFISIL